VYNRGHLNILNGVRKKIALGRSLGFEVRGKEEGEQRGLCGELAGAHVCRHFRNRALIYFCYFLKITSSPPC